jgi:hypothetical protein
VLSVALAALSGVAGAEISVEARLDRNDVEVAERITLTVTVSGTGSAAAPELPRLPDFSVFSAGTNRNFSFVNGKMASSTVHTFILAPKRQGSFEIPPIGVVDGKTRYTSRPLTVTVRPAGTSPAPPAPPPSTPPRSRGRRGTSSDKRAVFVTAEAKPRTAYLGEQVTLTVRFYQGVTLLERPDYVPPAATGFWVESLPDERTYYTDVGGRQYHVTELKTALFPTEAGELTIGPAEVKCVIKRDPFANPDPFSIFRGFGTGESRTVKTKPISITAEPIPRQKRPDDWSGAVGRYRIEAKLDPPQVRAGEAATFTVSLAGQGNIRAVGDPEPAEVAGLRIFDSRAEVEDTRKSGVFGGVKRISRVLVAEASGTYVIPSIRYPVFRPDLDQFEVIETRPITLEVLEAGDVGEEMLPGAGSANLISSQGANLRFIRLGDPGLRQARGRLWTSTGFWLAQLLPIVGFAAVLLIARHQERVRADQGYARLRRSASESRRRLKAARHHLEQGDARAFCGAVTEALVGYVADRTNVPAPALTVDGVGELLTSRGVDAAVVANLVACLERCNFGRFAPGADQATRELLADAEAVLRALPRAGL